jgi:hypothetical protein
MTGEIGLGVANNIELAHRSMSRRVEDRHLVKAIWAFIPRRSPASG